MTTTYYPPLGSFVNQQTTSFDLNSTSSVTTGVDVSMQKAVSVHVRLTSGGFGIAVITLQTSADNSNWDSTSSTLTAVGVLENIGVASRYVRVKVTTAAGLAGTATVDIQAK